jgi:predicted translin family RNA/ssDNA-binding protein
LSDLGEIYINRKGNYGITEEGKKYLNNLHRQLQDEESKKMDQKLERVMENIKQDFNEFTTDEILAFIYKKFPEYVEPSIKADKLNYKKIFLKMYEEGKIGISKIAELMDWSFERAYEFVKQNAKKVILR